MDGMIKCTVTEDAGTRIAGQPVKSGDVIELNQKNFDHYSMTGQVTTDAIKKSQAAAKKKAEAEAAEAAKANAGD